MNTFSDAQLIVSRDVADDAGPRRTAANGSSTADERDAIETLVENGFIVESREADHQALDEFFHNVREDRSQLRVTVLTTLQCNFACDYCIQGDHGDYNKHAAKMSLETAARTAEWAEAAAGRGGPFELRADVLRRRAAPQPAGSVLPGRAARRELPGARRADDDQHHHQRAAADAGDRRSADAAGPERHQGHARRRSRHAQQDAAAARGPGHLRPDPPERAAGRRQDAGSRSAATSTSRASTAIRRCSTSCASRSSPVSWRRSRSSRSSSRRSRPSRKARSR